MRNRLRQRFTSVFAFRHGGKLLGDLWIGQHVNLRLAFEHSMSVKERLVDRQGLFIDHIVVSIVHLAQLLKLELLKRGRQLCAKLCTWSVSC